MKREECIKMLRENEVFKSILQQMKDDKEKRYVKAYAEDFIVKFYDNVFVPLEKAHQNDPEGTRNAFLEVLQGRKEQTDAKKDTKE